MGNWMGKLTLTSNTDPLPPRPQTEQLLTCAPQQRHVRARAEDGAEGELSSICLSSSLPALFHVSALRGSSTALPAQLHPHQEHLPSFEKKQALALDLFGCFRLYLSKEKDKVRKV